MAKVLFIKRDDIVRNSVLSGNVDSDKFLQFIEIAQEIHIQNYLGTKLYDKLRMILLEVVYLLLMLRYWMTMYNRC